MRHEGGTTRAGRSRLPATVVVLGLTSLLTDAGSEMIFPLLPLFLGEVLGAGPAFLGVVEGAADAVASLLKLVSGDLSDRMGRRKPLVVAGYGLASAVRPLVAMATAPWHVLAVRLTDRVGKGVRSSPRDALLADAVDDARAGRAFGFHRAMDHAGAVIGPLLAAGLLGLGADLRTVFWCAAVPGALAFAVVLFGVREPSTVPGAVTETATGAATRAAPTAASSGCLAELSQPPPTPASVEMPGIGTIIHASDRHRNERASVRFGLFLLILALFALGNSSDAFLLLRARELGVPAAAIPLLWTVLHLAKMVFSYGGGAASDRFGRVPLVIVGWSVYAAVYVGFAIAGGPLAAWLLFALYGTYHGLVEPAEKALVRQLAPQGRGRAFGWYNFVTGVSALPAGLLTGWIWQVHGAATALLLGAALAGLASLALAAWAARYRHRAAA